MRLGLLGRRLAWIALAAPLSACRGPRPPDPDVVARFDGGEVRRSEVDRMILTLPAAQRRPEGGDVQGWYASMVRQTAVRRLLVEEAKRRGLDYDPAFQSLLEEHRRQMMVALYLSRRLASTPAISQVDLERYYQIHRAEFARPERRMVRHIFKRWGAEPRAVVLAEVAELKRKLEAGATFAQLAERFSDSESRHREGYLGWIQRHQVKPDVERVVFDLPEGAISDPVVTAEGVHLFHVERVLTAKQFAFDEVRLQIRERLESERRAQATEELMHDTPVPNGSMIPDAGELHRLLANGKPTTMVLRIGDYRMNLRQFRQLLQQAQRRVGGPPRADLPAQLIDGLRRRELLYLRCLAERTVEPDEVERSVAQATDRLLYEFYLPRWLSEALDREPQRLERYHSAHREAFQSLLRLRLRRLVLERPADADHKMAELEALVRDHRNEPAVLAASAARLGGVVEEVGWKRFGELSRIHSKLPELLSPLQAGQLSPPFRDRTSLQVWAVLERQNPRPLPLAQVREHVRERYLATQGQDLYHELTTALLESKHFKMGTGTNFSMTR